MEVNTQCLLLKYIFILGVPLNNADLEAKRTRYVEERHNKFFIQTNVHH